ncbi:MAG: ankyrin repeat domain-containing protein [bacterium]
MTMKKILIASMILAAVVMGLLYFLSLPPPSINDAVDADDIGRIQRLIRRGYDVNEEESNGYTPIMWAVGSTGRLEIVKILLTNGANVNVVAQGGETPLLIASYYGNMEIIGLLLAKGADTNVKDKKGRTPLSFAVLMGRKEQEDLLRAHGAKE